MKSSMIALALAFTSFAAYGADNTSSTAAQQMVETQNGQPQTTIPSDKAKPSNVQNTQNNQRVDPWTQLSEGWKQFEPAGKN
jgi:hypothetical protein